MPNYCVSLYHTGEPSAYMLSVATDADRYDSQRVISVSDLSGQVSTGVEEIMRPRTNPCTCRVTKVLENWDVERSHELDAT